MAEVPEVITPAATPAARPAKDRFALVVAGMPLPLFAVVDGGHFDDVASMLRSSGLLARSLFLGEAGRDVQRFGPWLVTVSRPADIATVLSITGDLPATVFWSCAGGHDALFDHLRRLNMARIPAWAAAGKTGPEAGVIADGKYEAVTFRHWDASVLCVLLPALDERQFCRILGPAAEIAFSAPGHGSPKRVVADPDWPIPPAGMLTIRSDQMLAMAETRLANSRQRMTAYLRKVAPDHTVHMTDDQLLAMAGRHQQEAFGLGIRNDRETFMWSFMRVTSVGDLSRDEGIVRFMAEPAYGPTPEARLKQLYALRTNYLRAAD